MSTTEVTCQVAIVGLGPVGATLAGLLGERGIDVIAVDPAIEPTPYPRAIAADDETLRTILRLPGIEDPIRLFDVGQRVEVRDAKARLVTKVSFNDSPLGVAGLSFFHQPSLERSLRAGLTKAPSVTSRFGVSVTHVRDIPDGVRLELDDASTITASWVVGCDGATSVVRRLRGIAYTGRSFAEPWIVVDIDSPHPLPHLPYFTYGLDARRPNVNMPRPGGHRFEFMVLAGEDPAEMTGQHQIDRWLEPFLAPLTAKARRELRIVRAAVYTYHARTAGRWRDGRVLLAGDAAHCMPPFGGQGLGAGVGDAVALAWRLDEVARGLAPLRLLDDYEKERRPRIAEMTRTALVAGRLLTATSPAAAAMARLALRAVDSTPVIGSAFRAGSLRAKPRVGARAPGGPPRSGEPLPNPLIRTRDGRVLRLDDVLAAGWVLIGKAVDPRIGLPPALAAALSCRSFATLCVVSPGDLAATAQVTCPAVEDLDGSLLDLWSRDRPGRLRRRRGEPASEAGHPLVALVRPDRFLAGVSHAPELAAAFALLTHA